MNRYLEAQILSDLKRKMVFVAGPRQVGKTTLAKSFLKSEKGYLNWDRASDRTSILKQEFPKSKLWVFDEIHKYRKWRNFLKGVYDGKSSAQEILVTGSARLDHYRFGGDSLQGRYHFLRMHPLSVAELKIEKQRDLNQLLDLGGFPEPFFSGSKIQSKRWSREYMSRLVVEEIQTIEQVQDLGSLQLLGERLPELVGSPLSINGIAEDIQISHKTIARWLQVFENLYAVFRLSPYGSPKLKAIKKAQKHYHFDWSVVTDKGARFENFVACHLLKWVHWEQDTKGRNLDLRYFRDVTGQEVDFVITEDRQPLHLIECKSSDREVSHSLAYLKAKFPNVRASQLSFDGKKHFVNKDGIEVMPALELLKELV